jgi:TolB-like protein/DNA-binding winged helix-turn-helix (wHTH) protein/Flp pilus assembly protein TadD
MPPLDSRVRFGPFELDARTGELWKAGSRINLPDQPFQVLTTLLERPGELVTREELRQRLWSAETFVDFEHGLNAAIRRLRDVLGDSADVPRFVETLPRRGYRFIAPVTGKTGGGEAVAPPPAPEIESDESTMPPAPPKSARFFTRRWVSAGIAALALIAAGMLWGSSYRPTSAKTAESTASTGRFMLAVLPFENLTGDADREFISDGMTDELIAELGQMDPPRLGVIARTSAMQFKKTKLRANEIGTDLGVGYLIEGSVRANGSRIVIGAQLIEAQHETQLWSEEHEGEASDLLMLQRQVSGAIARQISARLGIAPSHARKHSANQQAYIHYSRGRSHWSKDTSDQLQTAMNHFLAAIKLDQSYALAYSGLADTYILLGADGFMPMREAYLLAKGAAMTALKLDDTLGEAHGSLAAVMADYEWDWAEAERHFKSAVALSPNYEWSLTGYSFYLAYMKRPEEALNFAEQARRLDPVSPGAQTNLGLILYFDGRYDEAIAAVTETFEFAPDFGPAHVTLGRIYAAKGQADRAVRELELALQLMGRRPDVLTPYAYVLARAGRQREARAVLEELGRIANPRPPSPLRIAMVHIGLREVDQAFKWLDEAVKARDWQMALLNVEPSFDILKSDRRFAGLVEQVGLPVNGN